MARPDALRPVDLKRMLDPADVERLPAEVRPRAAVLAPDIEYLAPDGGRRSGSRLPSAAVSGGPREGGLHRSAAHQHRRAAIPPFLHELLPAQARPLQCRPGAMRSVRAAMKSVA